MSLKHGPDKRNSPTPSAVRFHAASGFFDDEAEFPLDDGTVAIDVQDLSPAINITNGNNKQGANGHANGNGREVAAGSDPVKRRVEPTLPPRAGKNTSQWHDSRISVEMHLSLLIEDLMLLAPGAKGEKEATTVGSDGAAGPLTPTAAPVPVDFDEDAEPDVTLEHVLAGVEYLLHTRIIGSANPLAEGVREEDEDEAEEKDDNPLASESPASDPAVTGLDSAGVPLPLVSAPQPLVDAEVTASSEAAPFVPETTGTKHEYFHFVSLDLALCDDLLTALCYHMRRAEVAWSLRPKASDEAKKALELFEGFFTYVYSFRCAVAARAASYLKASLKVSRHLRGEEKYKNMVVRLLMLLSHECPRIERWEDLVNPDEYAKVREIMNTREMKKLAKRLTKGKGEERESSLSRMASFKTSQQDASRTGPGEVKTAGNAKSNFPAFFSSRHGKLLPPKGACFDVEPHRLLKMFHTDLKKGLSGEEVKERQEMYGRNVLPPPHEANFLLLLWGQIKDFIILVLLSAAIVSAAIEDFESMAVLLFVVLVNVIIGLVQEYRSANALKALNSFAIPQAQVIRGGEQSLEPASDLVPGDIVVLEEGASCPADLRLIEVSQLSMIEAILTGESLPVLKSTAAIKPRSRRFLPVGDRTNMAFMSTLVSKGRGLGLVVNTGATTEVGRIYSALSASSAETIITPLQRKLGMLGKLLVLVSVLACGAVIGIGLGRGYGTEIIKIGISLAVSVIPEGLVTVVTLTMAIGTQRMAKKKAIARNLPAVETLGSITTICSDKTGTLTEGKMKTERMWAVDSTAGMSAENGGHSLRFVTASKVKSAAASTVEVVVHPAQVAPPANGIRLDGAIVAAIADAAASTAAANTVVHAGNGPAPSGAVSVLLNESLTVSTVQELPVPLLWNNMVCCLNNNAQVKLQDVLDAFGKNTGKQEEVMVGDATEVALLRSAQQAFVPLEFWNKEYGLGVRSLEFAFDSDRKRMSIVLELPAAVEEKQDFIGIVRPQGATHLLLVKGAPEAVLNKSESFLSSADQKKSVYAPTQMTPEVEQGIEKQGSSFASKGMRVLATAFKFLNKAQVDKFKADLVAANAAAEAGAVGGTDGAGDAAKEAPSGPSGADLISFDAECELCFIGLAGIMDPPRVEVADAIRTAHIAGIRVCMITGDHYDTALAIAKQIGIFSDERCDRAMNGDALAVLTEEQLSVLTPFPVVFSRVSPDNKLKLVKSLQRRGEICAMTGDGVNDSPAIKQADVGIAMGLGGTEVTRQAADIILSDDNFSTIVSSVGEGRRIYDNIVKFLVYLLTCNGAEVWVMLFAVILGMPVPFLSLMLLWANIFADIPPSLSLGLEEGELNAMQRPPRPADQNILTLPVVFIIMFDSISMAVMVLINYYHSYEIRGDSFAIARTFAFELLATLHLVHSFEARSLYESAFRRDMFTSNPALAFSFVLSMSFLIGGCYIPGLNHVLELEPIDGLEWGIIFINLVAHVIIIETKKFVLRIRNGRLEAARLATMVIKAPSQSQVEMQKI